MTQATYANVQIILQINEISETYVLVLRFNYVWRNLRDVINFVDAYRSAL